MEKILIDAESLVFGRVASIAAQKALQGTEVNIVNSEKTILSGTKEFVLKKFRRWINMRGKGNPEKGPQYSRMPDKILRTAIRKMLPKTTRGEKALERVKVFIGFPEEFKKQATAEMQAAVPKNLQKSVVLGEACRLLGARW